MSQAAEAVGVDPRLLRRASRVYGPLAWLLLLMAVAVPAYFVLRWPERTLDARLAPLVATILAVMVMTLVLGAFAMWRMGAWLREQRLAATRTHLSIMAPRGCGLLPSREARVSWKDVYFDGGRLLAGRHLVIVRIPLGEVFGAEALARLLAARLPDSHRVSPGMLTRTAWKAGAFRAHLAILAGGLAVGLAAILGMEHIIAPLLPVPP